MTDKTFDVQTGLIQAFLEIGAEDAKKIESLQRQLNDAYRFTAYLIDRFGTEVAPGRKVLRVNRWDLVNAPANPEILRWEDVASGDICLGVRKNEH